MAENGGAPVAVTLDGGSTTAYSNFERVTLSGLNFSESFTVSGVAVPAAPLDPKESYYIEGQLQSTPFAFPVSPPYSDVAATTSSSGNQVGTTTPAAATSPITSRQCQSA